MAKAKFEKYSEIWNMFMDFWKLCQDYWWLEDTDEWWAEVDAATKKFATDYGNRTFPRMLAAALIGHLEEQKKRKTESETEGIER